MFFYILLIFASRIRTIPRIQTVSDASGPFVRRSLHAMLEVTLWTDKPSGWPSSKIPGWHLHHSFFYRFFFGEISGEERNFAYVWMPWNIQAPDLVNIDMSAVFFCIDMIAVFWIVCPILCIYMWRDESQKKKRGLVWSELVFTIKCGRSQNWMMERKTEKLNVH
jgi:hypothetical protein